MTTTTTRRRTAAERELHAELRALRSAWRTWKTCEGLHHPEFYGMSCGVKFATGNSCDACDGCAMEQYRAERRTEIERQAAVVKAALAKFEAVAR